MILLLGVEPCWFQNVTGAVKPCGHQSVFWQCWFLLLVFLTWPHCRIFDKIYLVKFSVFPSVVKLLQQLPCTASCSQKLGEWEGIWAFAVLSWFLWNVSPSCRSQLLTEWVSLSTVRSNQEQPLASEQANLQVELCSSFSVTIIWSFPAQSVGFGCVALLLMRWTAALAAVHRCIQECVWKFVVFQGEEFREWEVLLYVFEVLYKTRQTKPT